MKKWQICLEWALNVGAISLPLLILGSGLRGIITQSPLHPDAAVVLGGLGLAIISLGGLLVYGTRPMRRDQRWLRWGYGGLFVVGVGLGGLALNPPEWLLRWLIPGY
ncbi:hypothetical protein [Levilactobacillus acidifarinae]|uniref:Integral membrane protein n=1 Tax=Levilactobacillus acidifarinae DSM 19394 = JCM 15949 TaxID=1423715 RepID=A0A0R1LJG9_9LACO|nr:hypothetical protein [Levilactobacillus acidifarinae]KRK96108.1 hypothetical protein FD25_GL002571 [Levilactobacillus acidifarinae DSM 19394]GEO69619.1 hypothetical protein LAC03_15290 [Levilactobacillus acidifarinae]